MAAKNPKSSQTRNRQSTAVVPYPVGPVALPPGVSVVKQIIMPTLSLKIGEPKVLLCVGAMRQSTFVDPDPAKAKEKPAIIMPVGDTQTGEALTLLVPVLLEKNLVESYPDEGYVGKTFLIEKLPKRQGKRYFDLRLLEVTVEKQAA